MPFISLIAGGEMLMSTNQNVEKKQERRKENYSGRV